MPHGIRTRGRGRKTVETKPTPYFEYHGHTRASTTIPWGGRSATQEEVDRTRNNIMRQQSERMSTPEWNDEAAANDRARLENQARYGERPPSPRGRRINIQGQR